MAQPKEILIVDDEVGIRELLSEILQDEGYRVSLAENAGQARSYRGRTEPALVPQERRFRTTVRPSDNGILPAPTAGRC